MIKKRNPLFQNLTIFGFGQAFNLVQAYNKMIEANYNCLFGSGFIKGEKAVDYPCIQKIIRKIANFCVKLVVLIKDNDSANTFKLYKRKVINGVNPILSSYFSIKI